MDFIIQWIKNLIFIILFTALLEMFLPENALRKYVRVIMGFFVISILISPLSMILKQDFSGLHNIIPEGITNNWDEIEESGQKLNTSNEDLLMEYYQKKIKERVSEVIKLGYSDYNEDIQLSLDANYGISRLKITLRNKGVENIEIAPVEIDDTEEGDDSEEEIIQRKYDMEKLKYNLAQVFQINPEIIEVYYKAGEC